MEKEVATISRRSTLGSDVPVSSMSSPKVPPYKGEGTAVSPAVSTVAPSSPKLPPLQGD